MLRGSYSGQAGVRPVRRRWRKKARAETLGRGHAERTSFLLRVEIVSPPAGSKSDADLVTVAARIEDRGKGIGRIEWRVSGITVGVSNAPADAGAVFEVRSLRSIQARTPSRL
jgi:hypothetical protein